MINSILDIPEILIQKGLPFAIYLLPKPDNFTLVFQKDSQIHNIDILDIENNSGFVIARFDSAKTGLATIIKPDFIINSDDELGAVIEFLNQIPDVGAYHFIDNTSISKEEYIDRVSYLIEKLEGNELQKVVFSRVVKREISKDLHIANLLSLLREKYKNAFINMFHIPGEGTWCGASPETLFKITNNTIHTDALAGTKLASENNGNPVWTNKEKEEQYYVTLFIESLLSELGIHCYTKTGPITINAGSIAHLRTNFSIPISELKSKEGKLIAGLHPTPAVCGLPKAEAYILIQKAERHQRRYYTGFLGPWKLAGSTQLFVNLRCAELSKKFVNIYVGGGLTASSNPNDEYMETVHKSKTLLSVIENL